MSYALHYADVSKIVFCEPLYKWLPDNELAVRLHDIDLLALTCYVWNQEYNHHIATLYKTINPNGKVIFGGPNIPIDPLLHQDTVEKYLCVDAFLAGPGEEIFCDILSNIDQPCNLWNGCYGKSFNNAQIKPSQISSERMPQPYLDGLFDSILTRERRIKASFETNRGCPFKCAFCDWGGQANSKVTKFSTDAVKATIDYIYSWSSVSEIEILDANFGMQQRDLDTLMHMIAAKNKTGNNPTVSYSGLVKNGSPYLIDIIDIIHNKLGAERRHLKLSFQSHSRNTLAVMLRDNIRNEKLLGLLGSLRDKDIEVSSEMIIGMPGETALSWLDNQATDYDHGIGFMRTYLLSLVCNTRLYEHDFRVRHGIRSKKLLIPYEMRDVARMMLALNPLHTVSHKKQFEVMEIVHHCSSFDCEELVLMFRYFWWYHNFYNSHAFRHTIADLRRCKYSIRDQILTFYSNLHMDSVLGSLVSNQDQLIRKIFADEPTTVIDDYATYRFISGSLRTNDLFVMLQNKSAIESEMLEIYHDTNIDADKVRMDIAAWSTDLDEKVVTKLFNMGSRIS